ncbi:MAG TPA: helix-turn-helix domain-containing protein [Solirubrobacteraceae bacterium]|nr:helix-turn-helix domain-containing protein [Solirubrobacteraceae bacterium]
MIPLLDAEPDLGRLMSAEQIEQARSQLLIRRHVVEAGPWDGERLRDAGPEHVGLLILDGLMTRELALADNVSGELLGPGDLVRPWQAGGPERLVPYEVRWTALERTALGVLDRRFALALTHYPQINAMLIDRLTERSQRISLMQSISQLNGVDRRLLTLFWHLAERWGRVTASGVAVPVPVPHRVLAQLVGARRPTVSTALSRLAESGELTREPNGGWLLTGAPVGIPTEEAARIIRVRRHHAEQRPPEPLERNGLPPTGRIADLVDELATLRAATARRRDDTAALAAQTRELFERLQAGRERRQADRGPD